MTQQVQAATQAEHNRVYQGFDIQSIKRCTSKVLGFQVCAEASTDGGVVFLKLTAVTPFGDFSKTFEINANIDFQFKPIDAVEINVSVTNFTINADSVSFDLNIEGCIDLPVIGKKCVESTFSFEVPLPFAARNLSFEGMSSGDLALRLIAALDPKCSCNN